MGVEYRYFLIPRDNTVRPDAVAIALLIEAWRENNFIVRPGSLQHARMTFRGMTTHAHAAATGVSAHTAKGWRSFNEEEPGALNEGELILQWPVCDRLEGGLNHPLGIADFDGDGAYYDLELHFSDDFVSICNEMIDALDAQCSCGEDLVYSLWPNHRADIFYAGRVRRVCPGCGSLFRPQEFLVPYRDGRTREESLLRGGATYRFAIVVDCGKGWFGSENEKSSPAATNEFLSTSVRALNIDLYGVGHFY